MPVYLAVDRNQRPLPMGVAEKLSKNPMWILTQLELSSEQEPSKSSQNQMESQKTPEWKDYSFSGFTGPTMGNDFVLQSVAAYHIQIILETLLAHKNISPQSQELALNTAHRLASQLGPNPKASWNQKILEIKDQLKGEAR